MFDRRIARTYAKVFVDIAAEDGEIEKYGEQLDALVEATKDLPDIAAYLDDQKVPDFRRQKTIEEIADKFRLASMIENFLHVLVDRRRMSFLPLIASEYQDLADERRGIVNVHVRSAMPLTKEQEQEISSAYAKLSGGKPVLRVTVDRELISGLRVEVDNKVINNSLDARLEMLREGLSKR